MKFYLQPKESPPISSKKDDFCEPLAICKLPKNNFLLNLIFLLKSKLRCAGAFLGKIRIL